MARKHILLLVVLVVVTLTIFSLAWSYRSDGLPGEPLASIETTSSERIKIVALPNRSGVLIETITGVSLWDLDTGDVRDLSSGSGLDFARIGAAGNDSAIIFDGERRFIRVDYETLDTEPVDIPDLDQLEGIRPLPEGVMLGVAPQGFVYWDPGSGDSIRPLQFTAPPAELPGYDLLPSFVDNYVFDLGFALDGDRSFNDVQRRWLIDIPSETATLQEVVMPDERRISWRAGFGGRIWAAHGDNERIDPILWEPGQELRELPISHDVIRISELPNDILAVTFVEDDSLSTDFIDRKSLESVRQVQGVDFDQPIVVDDTTLVLVVGHRTSDRTERRVELWRIDDLTRR